jgi:glycosyltransferase involved in cell wall biosynthesis
LKPRVSIVYPKRKVLTDALSDHSGQLARALRAHAEVEGESLSPWSRRLREADAVIVQYNPFSYGHWGFAPSLILALLSLRLRRARPRIALMVHEPYVPMTNWRLVLMGLWQRLQLRIVAAAADHVFCSTELFARELATKRYSRNVSHLPVASNLPDMRGSRAEERERLGVSDGSLVIAMLGTGHPSRLPGHLERAVKAIARRSDGVTVLNLGDGAAALRGLPDEVRVHAPGRQPADMLARELACADLFLAPFVDGVSTRRGSMMAALQHAVPVVGTDGFITDGLLRRHRDALRLVPVDGREAFAEAAAELALDPDRRQELGGAGRALYEQSLDWPVIARSLIEALDLEPHRRTVREPARTP